MLQMVSNMRTLYKITVENNCDTVSYKISNVSPYFALFKANICGSDLKPGTKLLVQ